MPEQQNLWDADWQPVDEKDDPFAGDWEAVTSESKSPWEADWQPERKEAPSFGGRVKESWETGEKQVDIGQLSFAQILGDKTPETEERIQAIEETMPQGIGPDRSLPEQAVRAAAEMAPIPWTGIKKGVKRGIPLSVGFGTIAALAGPAAPITVPAAAVAGFSVGMISAALENIGGIEGGLGYRQFKELKDPDTGEKMNDTVAKIAGLGVGVINGALEVWQIKTFLRSIPGASVLVRKGINESVKKVLRSRALKSIAFRAAKKYVGGVAKETGQEIMQEVVNISGQYMATEVNNALKGTNIPKQTRGEIVDQLLETGRQSALAFSVFMAPGTAVSTTGDVVTRKKGAIDESHDLLTDDKKAGEFEKTLRENFNSGKINSGDLAKFKATLPKKHTAHKIIDGLLKESQASTVEKDLMTGEDINLTPEKVEPEPPIIPVEQVGFEQVTEEMPIGHPETAIPMPGAYPELAGTSAKDSAWEFEQERIEGERREHEALRLQEEEAAKEERVRQSRAGYEGLVGEVAERAERESVEGLEYTVPYLEGLLERTKLGEPGKRIKVEDYDGTEKWFGVGSDYPEFMVSKYGKKEVIKALEKGLAGYEFPLREVRQAQIWDDAKEQAIEMRNHDLKTAAEMYIEEPETIEGLPDSDYKLLITELQNEGHDTRAIEEIAARHRKEIEGDVIAEIANDHGFPEEEIRALIDDPLEPIADMEIAWKEATKTKPVSAYLTPITEAEHYDIEEERRLARPEREGKEPGRAVPVEGRGEKEAEAGRVLQEPSAEETKQKGELIANLINEKLLPGHDLKYDGIFAFMPGIPPVYQFTPHAGPAHRYTIAHTDLEADKILEKLKTKIDQCLAAKAKKEAAIKVSEAIRPEFSELVQKAQEWKGAAINADKLYPKDNKRARLKHSQMTTKGDLDAYLMKEFDLDAVTARDVSNQLTKENLPAKSTDVEDFRGEPWADAALAYKEKPGRVTKPVPKETLREVFKDPAASQAEVIREKAHLKRQVIEGVKSGKYKGAVRFSTVVDLKKTIEQDKLYVSRYGEIHATPILGPDDDAFPAYGPYKNHAVAYIIPEKHIKGKPDAHTKEVLVDPDASLADITFLVDGQDKEFDILDMINAVEGAKRPLPEELMTEYHDKYGKPETYELYKDTSADAGRYDWRGAVIHKSTLHEGGWRITYFDEDGFSNHSEHKTVEACFEAAIYDGIVTPKPGLLDKAAKKKGFIEKTVGTYDAQMAHFKKMTGAKEEKVGKVDAEATRKQIKSILTKLKNGLKRGPDGEYKATQTSLDTLYDDLKWKLNDLREQGDLDEKTIDAIKVAGIVDQAHLVRILPEAEKEEKKAEGVKKEPWKMSKDEYRDFYLEEVYKAELSEDGTLKYFESWKKRKDEFYHTALNNAEDTRELEIQDALDKGKDIPESVLAEFSHLVKEGKEEKAAESNVDKQLRSAGAKNKHFYLDDFVNYISERQNKLETFTKTVSGKQVSVTSVAAGNAIFKLDGLRTYAPAAFDDAYNKAPAWLRSIHDEWERDQGRDPESPVGVKTEKKAPVVEYHDAETLAKQGFTSWDSRQGYDTDEDALQLLSHWQGRNPLVEFRLSRHDDGTLSVWGKPAELHLMTKSEQVENVGRPIKEHREAIVAAHEAGKTIPTEVLNDFPEISKRLGFKKKEKAKEPLVLTPEKGTPWERQAELEKEGIVKRPEKEPSQRAAFPEGGISKAGMVGRQQGLFGAEKGETVDMFAEAEERAALEKKEPPILSIYDPVNVRGKVSDGNWSVSYEVPSELGKTGRQTNKKYFWTKKEAQAWVEETRKSMEAVAEEAAGPVLETAKDYKDMISGTTIEINKLQARKDKLHKQAIKLTPFSAQRDKLTADGQKITKKLNALRKEVASFQEGLAKLEKKTGDTLESVRENAKKGKKAGIEYVAQMEVAETGDVIDVPMDAGTALVEADKRLENYNKLLECIESD